MNKIKLSTYAKKNNLCYRTAYNYFHAGTLKGEQLASGTILVYEDQTNSKVKNEKIVIYCKESTSDNDQTKRVSDFCAANGWIINKTIIENEFNKRLKFLSLLEDTSVTKIVIENNDMLCKFGIESIKILLKSQGRELIIINETKDLNATC